MKVTIANKKLLSKPQTDLSKASYFKDLKFKTGNFKDDTFKKIIENGITITYLYNDSEFNRSNHYMVNNYLGTQFICVDIDKSDLSPKSFVESIKYKPTYYHTTFSNLTEQKENKYCFHLIYCFDGIIYGEENFKDVFNKLTYDYSEYVDKAAKDCHRVMFTSNHTLPNYEFGDLGNIYKVNDFVGDSENKEFDDLDNFFTDNTNGKNNNNALLSTTTNNKRENEKNFPKDKNQVKMKNYFHLEESFFNDLNSLTRSEFLRKYLEIYPYINSTVITDDLIRETKEGILFANLKNIDYYEVPSKFRYNPTSNKKEIFKVEKGNRTKYLMEDALYFIKCIPNITKEYLVTMLINEVYKYYNNTDKELSNYKIISIAKWAMELPNINIEPSKRKFKILYAENKMKAVGVLNKLMKDEEIGENLDLSISLEENIKEFKKNGIKITKNRINQFLKDYDIQLKTDKEIRNDAVIQLHIENPSLSSRKLEKLCKENGINITYKTIQSIIKKYTDGK